MKLFRLNILAVLLLLALASKGQLGSNVLNRLISFDADSITKTTFLDSIALVYNIHFSYNPDLLEADQLISIHANNQPLFTILKSITNLEILDFKALENQVIFFPVIAEESAKIIKPIIKAMGVVYTDRNQETIPYCNIGIKNKALGSITNMNGEFTVLIPEKYINDTLCFSAIGYEVQYLAIKQIPADSLQIVLPRKIYHLKSIDIVRYNPLAVLDSVYSKINNNYENEHTLLTTFYRELIKENEEFTDVSEAVLQVLKAPYKRSIADDKVKFLKGRKGTVVKPLNDIRFRLKGGPYYITKLDVVKNHESFINEEFKHLYSYQFEKVIKMDDRETIVLNFSPINNLKDILFEGTIYIDRLTWAVARTDFQYTRQGLKEARRTLIQKEPKHSKAIPTQLEYSVKYKMIQGKWYVHNARSSMKIKINNREEKVRTKFHSIAELLTTNIEKGKFDNFTRQEIFKSNEIFTDKIVSYDEDFWKSYNVITPEQDLIDALKTFDNQNLVITNF